MVIPARDEEGSLPSTLEDLHRTLEANGIPYEIVVVDDGSTDRTWPVLLELQKKIPTLAPTRNHGVHGFGRAVVWGFDHSRGDAIVIMMADASDSAADAVNYWRLLNEGYDCVFGSRFIKGGQVIDYPRLKLLVNRLANYFVRVAFRISLNDTTNAFKGVPPRGHRRLPAVSGAAFQPHGRDPAQGDRARLHLDGRSDFLEKPPAWRGEAEDQGNGQPVFFHLHVCLAGKIFQPRRLSPEVRSPAAPVSSKQAEGRAFYSSAR